MAPVAAVAWVAAAQALAVQIERSLVIDAQPALAITLRLPFSGRLVVRRAGPGAVPLRLYGAEPAWPSHRDTLISALAESGLRAHWR